MCESAVYYNLDSWHGADCNCCNMKNCKKNVHKTQCNEIMIMFIAPKFALDTSPTFLSNLYIKIFCFVCMVIVKNHLGNSVKRHDASHKTAVFRPKFAINRQNDVFVLSCSRSPSGFSYQNILPWLWCDYFVKILISLIQLHKQFSDANPKSKSVVSVEHSRASQQNSSNGHQDSRVRVLQMPHILWIFTVESHRFESWGFCRK